MVTVIENTIMEGTHKDPKFMASVNIAAAQASIDNVDQLMEDVECVAATTFFPDFSFHLNSGTPPLHCLLGSIVESLAPLSISLHLRLISRLCVCFVQSSRVAWSVLVPVEHEFLP